MNKNCYRIVFSKSKNMFIAVAENTKTQTKVVRQSTNSNQINDSSEVHDSKAFHQMWQVKTIVASMSLLIAFSPLYAQIHVDPATTAHQQANIGLGKNQQGQNVPVINIQTPRNGLSHNVYNQFDVLQPGVVLNNSRNGAGSVIAGQVGANPYLQTGEARVILNEINSVTPSRFEGNLEVAGQRADVIIANPSGINIQGGGFINANKAIFTTGKPQLNKDGSIKQFVIDQGKININSTENNLGLGGNNNNADYVDIYAKAVKLNAQVHANQNLQVITGSNTISEDLNEIETNNPKSISPTFTLDVKALGGMYANNIFIVGTDKGLGVNNAGTIQSLQNLVITSSGKIENTGAIQTVNLQDSLLSISTDDGADIVSSGSIITNGNLFIDSEKNLIINQGEIEKTGADNQNIISLSAKGDINLQNGTNVKNNGEGGNLYISANNITLGQDVNVSGNGLVALEAQQSFKADGIRNLSSIHDINLSAGDTLSLINIPIYAHTGNINLGTTKEDSNVLLNSTILNAENHLNIYGVGAVSINNLILDKVGEVAKTKNLNVKAQGDLTWTNTGTLPILSGQLNLLSNGKLDISRTQLTANEGINLQGKKVVVNSGLTSNKDISIVALEGDIKSNDLYINSKSGKASVVAKGHVDLQDPNFSDPHIKPIQINAQKDIVIGSTDSAVNLRSAKLISNEGSIKVQSNDVANISETDLKAKDNIELFSQKDLIFQATLAHSQQHIAINSNNNITFNSPPVFDDLADQGSSPNTQLTAPGIISIISGNNLNALDLTATGGAILIEAGESFNTPSKVVLNAIGSDFLKNDTKLNSTNSDLTIQTNHALTLDPKIHQLNANGDIELISKNGALTLLGYSGDNGNGSEQVINLNTNGSINLQGTQVELQGSQLEAQKDIKVVSSDGNVLINGIKNNFSNKFSSLQLDFANKNKIEAEAKLNNINTPEYIQDFNDVANYDIQESSKLFFVHFDPTLTDEEKIKLRDKAKLNVNNKLNNFFKKYSVKRSDVYPYALLYDLFTGLPNDPKVLFVPDYGELNAAKNDIKFFSQKLNGYQHLNSKLTSDSGNIQITSAEGTSVSGAELTAKSGLVNIEAYGSLDKIYTSIAKKIDGEQKTLGASIIIDGTKDFYDKGSEYDKNYSFRTLINPTIISGNQGVNIKTVGMTENDNLVMQATGIESKNGDIRIESNKNILLDSAFEQSYDRSTSTHVKKSWGGLKKKVTTANTENNNISASSVDIAGTNIFIESKEENPNVSIDIYSGKFLADGGQVYIRAGGNLNFFTVEELSKTQEDVTKQSSFASIKYNNSKSNTTREQVSSIPAHLKADYLGTKSGFDTRLEGTEFEYLKGATIESGGKLELIAAKDKITDIVKKESNSVVWQSMQDSGSITETAKLPSFNGPTPPAFKADGGIEVQIPIGEKDQYKVQIRDEIIKLANQPGNEYLNEFVKRDDVNWNTVILTQQEWDYKSQGLTGPGAALVVIIVTVLTSGAGTAAAGAVGGGAVGAGAQAAVATLASQASVSLINNGGDISKTLKDLGSKESIKGLVTSVVTAGLLSEVGAILNLEPNPTLFSDRLIQNFTNSVGSTLVQTSVNGGDLTDNLEKALLSGLAGALQGQLANEISIHLEDLGELNEVLEYIVHKIAHAAAACSTAAATQGKCQAGAIGASVGEIVASFMPDPSNGDEYSTEEKLRNKNAGKLIAGVVAAYSGHDVVEAAKSADTAIENNHNTKASPKRSLFSYMAKKAVDYLTPYSSTDVKVVADYWLRRTDKNTLQKIDIDHIAQGHVTTSKDGIRAVGFHHEPSGGVTSRVKEVISKPDQNGVWEGSVEVLDPASNSWIQKTGNQGKSTFFPSGWSKEQLQFELAESFKIGEKQGFTNTAKPKSFESKTPSGVLVKWVPPNGTTVKQWRGWPIK